MSKSRLHDLLRLQYVQHWGVIPTTRRQSVAEHSFNVAVIVQELINRIPYSGTIVAVRWALAHDGPECATGDFPGNLKGDFPEFKDMVNWMESYYCPWYKEERALPNDQEHAIVKLADHLELLMFITNFIALPVEDGWVIHRERKIVQEMTATMTNKYGWKNLPAIVDEILGPGMCQGLLENQLNAGGDHRGIEPVQGQPISSPNPGLQQPPAK